MKNNLLKAFRGDISKTSTLGGITRLEVISETGREYVVRDIEFGEPSIQDEGRTLKLFIKRKAENVKS